ncbi:MAG: Tim44 domain-containing protein [Propionivibrio sp.]|nr:Tim44 domain-containing protein [Propionivibrio sp.]
MKKSILAAFAVFMALGLSVGNAEAKRMGGGKSFGMQRQAVPPKPATPAQQATPAAPASPAAAPAAAPQRNWMGPLAGLAAGLGIAALLSHFGMGEGLANILMIALLVMAAFFVFKLLFRRKTAAAPPAAHEPLQYAGAGAGGPAMAPPPVTPQLPGSLAPAAVATSAGRIPEGFDSEGFLRVAKLNFIRLQAANDAGNLDDIREFVSPELFAEIRMQMDERGKAAQQTDIVTLNAELLEVSTEGSRHIASVHFSGMIREEADAAAAPFDEVWNLSKPSEGGKGWVIAGIQQLG